LGLSSGRIQFESRVAVAEARGQFGDSSETLRKAKVGRGSQYQYQRSGEVIEEREGSASGPVNWKL
jgi:hypothetical protein